MARTLQDNLVGLGMPGPLAKQVQDNMIERVAVPASAAAAGSIGQWAAASGFIYVCVAASTWQRVAIATW